MGGCLLFNPNLRVVPTLNNLTSRNAQGAIQTIAITTQIHSNATTNTTTDPQFQISLGHIAISAIGAVLISVPSTAAQRIHLEPIIRYGRGVQ